MPYVLWVAAYNTSFILGYLILDTTFFHVPEPGKFPYNIRKRKTSSASRTGAPRATSPVRRSDRGPNVSPTEAAVAAASSNSYSDFETQSAADNSQTLPFVSTPSPSRLKRSASKRAAHSEATEKIKGGDVAPAYFYSPQSHEESDPSTQSSYSSISRRAPELLEAINKNGLAIFLLVSKFSYYALLSVTHTNYVDQCISWSFVITMFTFRQMF